MQIVVTGGGTGGHVFPAIEIAKALAAQGVEVLYIGNKDSLEEQVATKANFTFVGLKTKKLVGEAFVGKILALFYLALSIAECFWLFIKKRPQAVVGVGGYVSAPALIASFVLAIPRYIAEQNVVPGFANKALGTIATKIFISFAKSAKHFPENRCLLTGNPIRQGFFTKEGPFSRRPLTILVTGGSMGAAFLNEEVPKALAKAKDSGAKLLITHQTGKAKVADVLQRYKSYDLDAKVVPFIEAMPEAFADHDLIISRAGATVIFEIMASGMPAILIPYRFAGGHQQANAKALLEKGAAKVIPEGENFASELANIVKELYDHPQELQLLSAKVRAMATPNAAQDIVAVLIKTTH